jgi:hypothetical protein
MRLFIGWLFAAVSLWAVGVLPAAAQAPRSLPITFLPDADTGEIDAIATLEVGPAWPAAAVAQMFMNYKDARNYLVFEATGASARLVEVRDGSPDTLATAKSWSALAAQGTHTLTFKRRNWALRVLCDGKTVVSAFDDFAPGDRVGVASVGVRLTDLHTQPIGETVFHDDFSRPPGEPDPWNVELGRWAIRLPESRNNSSDPVKTANPFSLMASGSPALCTAGQTFWDSYLVTAAVKPEVTAADTDPGAVGLAAYLTDRDNCYLFRVWAANAGAAPRKDNAELVRRLGGVETVLATGTAQLITGRWTTLGLRVFGDRLVGIVDGEEVCHAFDATFGEGKIGLYTLQCPKAHFDDVTLNYAACYEDDYGPDGQMPIQQLAGYWNIYQERLCTRPDPKTRTAIGLTGDRAWTNYQVEADLIRWSTSAVGLCFGVIGSGDYYLFRWGCGRDNPATDVQELWKVAGGKSSLLAQRQAPLDRQTPHRTAITYDRGYLCVRVDGATVLEAVDTSRPCSGRVGYYAEGDARAIGAFDNLRISFCPPPKEPVSITEQFAKEDTMADWARPIASWRPLGARIYVWDLPVWGDFVVRVNAASLLGSSGAVNLCSGTNLDKSADWAPLVSISSVAGERNLRCSVTPAAGVEFKGTISPGSSEPEIELERRGTCLIVSADGRPIAGGCMTDRAQDPWIALKLEGVGVSLNEATLTSPNILDYAFAGAPTDWAPREGIWEISDRWNCQPGWSWFCGREADTPLIWSKQSFSGDIVFEFWAAPMMDLPASQGGYSHPSDLNGIICGDGKNLCSGYAFVLAGDNNTRSKLLRLGQTVAENAAFRFLNPTCRGDLNQFHRHWFHCRLEKTGGHLRYSIDGQVAMDWDDPNPLSGGRVGIWTYQHNGIMIARARVAYKN